VENNFKKGLQNLFDYSLGSDKDSGLNKFSKKGSEIKAGLTLLSLKINDTKIKLLDDIQILSDSIPVKPDAIYTTWGGNEYLLDFTPKKYSFDVIYPKEDNAKNSDAEKMCNYNSFMEKYVNLCSDKNKIDSIKRNIDDNKTYTLNADQLTLLGL
jgi:hypothetical protein